MTTATDEDICARCDNFSPLKPTGPAPWEVPAICAAGWPCEWSSLTPLAMDKFQEWRLVHGKSLEASE